MKFRFLLLFCFCASPFFLFAQTPIPSGFRTDALHTGADEVQVWSGYSPDSISWIGKTESRRLFLAGFGWRRVIVASDSVAWKFTVDVVPVALVSQPTVNGATVVDDPKQLFSICGTPAACGVTVGRRTDYGFGLEPVGFDFNFRRRRRFQPVTGINGGFLKFGHDVPVSNSNSFDFTFSLRAGLQMFVSESRSVTVGYRYHHISNANTGNPFNPGIDSNLIYAGFSFHK